MSTNVLQWQQRHDARSMSSRCLQRKSRIVIFLEATLWKSQTEMFLICLACGEQARWQFANFHDQFEGCCKPIRDACFLFVGSFEQNNILWCVFVILGHAVLWLLPILNIRAKQVLLQSGLVFAAKHDMRQHVLLAENEECQSLGCPFGMLPRTAMLPNPTQLVMNKRTRFSRSRSKANSSRQQRSFKSVLIIWWQEQGVHIAKQPVDMIDAMRLLA